MLAPIVPTLMTNFMASRRAGHPVMCEQYPPSKQPPECQDAYSDVVFWSSASSFVSNGMTFLLVRTLFRGEAMLDGPRRVTTKRPASVPDHVLSAVSDTLRLMLMGAFDRQAPLVGRWSDLHGRKPFMLIAMVFSALPACVLVLYLYFGTSLLWCALLGLIVKLLWLSECSRQPPIGGSALLASDNFIHRVVPRYYPAQALGGGVSMISLSLAYVADLLLPSHRCAAAEAHSGCRALITKLKPRDMWQLLTWGLDLSTFAVTWQGVGIRDHHGIVLAGHPHWAGRRRVPEPAVGGVYRGRLRRSLHAVHLVFAPGVPVTGSQRGGALAQHLYE